MEISVKINNQIELPSSNNKYIYKKTKNIEILQNNEYFLEQKNHPIPISNTPPNDFLDVLKKRIDNYFYCNE